jgi:hypothetical protein
MQKAQSTVLVGGGALILALSACSGDDDAATSDVSGVFRGTYEVPIVTPDLASAAVYDVPEVEWKVANGTAELSYDLPLGLVGKKVRVDFSGALDASGATGELAGAPGTAACDVASAEVICNEDMAGLLPLSPDYAVIEQLAMTEYGGPSSHRVDVAMAFAADPIGIVKVNLGAPVGSHMETEKPED